MTTTQHGVTPAPGVPDEKAVATTAAKFALRGHALHRTVRDDDGRVTHPARRWGESRAFTAWHDVLGFLAQLGGAE